MQDKLKFHLFVTLLSKRKGLRVRLRVLPGSRNFQTFREIQIPGATLMSHGLYLAFPTPPKIKDPALLGVLNQKILRDEELRTQFGVFWSAREFRISEENLQSKFNDSLKECLGKRTDLGDPLEPEKIYLWAHNLSLIKNGIIKNLRHSLDLDSVMGKYFKSDSTELHFQEFCAQTMPELPIPPIEYESLGTVGATEVLGPPDAYPIAPSLIFLRFMQSLVQKYQKSPPRKKGNSKIVPEHENYCHNIWQSQKPTQQVQIPTSAMKAIAKLLVSFHSTLIHLKRFLPPKDPVDLQLYDSVVQNTQNELQDLSNAVLTALLEPLCSTLGKLSTEGIIHPAQVTLESCQSVLATKMLMEKLRHFGEQEFSNISLEALEISMPSFASLASYPFLEALSQCLRIEEFQKPFFHSVQTALQPYNLDSDILDKAVKYLVAKNRPKTGPVHWLMENYVTSEFTRPTDKFMSTICDFKFCVFGSARNNQLVRFCPRADEVDDWKLMAIITFRQTSVCIITELVKLEEQLESEAENSKAHLGDTITHIKVFRMGAEVAAFKLKPNQIMGKEYCAIRSIQYFTGRYFVKYEMSLSRETTELFVLDLAPCLFAEPRTPKYHSKLLSELIGPDDPLPFDYACTDQFLSYIATNPNRNRRGRRTPTPGILGFIKFSRLDGPNPVDTLHCGDLFERIERQAGGAIYSNMESTCQILWGNDLRRLFYTNWSYDEKFITKRYLVIACFEVPPTLDSIGTIAFANFQLNHLIEAELLVKNTPKFSIMSIGTLEYVVMDLLQYIECPDQRSTTTPRILARALFTLHKNKLHWVPVNGQLLPMFPQSIGKQVGYAGYDTSIMSLFHQRRVFSSDKIVCNLYRLDYRAL